MGRKKKSFQLSWRCLNWCFLKNSKIKKMFKKLGVGIIRIIKLSDFEWKIEGQCSHWNLLIFHSQSLNWQKKKIQIYFLFYVFHPWTLDKPHQTLTSFNQGAILAENRKHTYFIRYYVFRHRNGKINFFIENTGKIQCDIKMRKKRKILASEPK